MAACVDVSPACERITGYTPGKFMADPRLIDAIILPETERYLVQVFADSKISR